jgi:hypothetical protein
MDYMLRNKESVIAIASVAAFIVLFILAITFWITGILRNQRAVIYFSVFLLIFALSVAAINDSSLAINLAGCFLILHGIASLVLRGYVKEAGIVSKRKLSSLGIGCLIFGAICAFLIM